jgi:hypothetical protein
MDDYIQCLIAAGWVDAGIDDDEYNKYLDRVRSDPELEVMTYDNWCRVMAEVDAINRRWDQEVEPWFRSDPREMPPEVRKLETELIHDMNFYDCLLGY